MGVPSTAPTRRRDAPGAALRPVQAFSISQTADAVVARLKAGEVATGIEQLEAARAGKSNAVQDALDRLVSVRSGKCYAPPPGAEPPVAAALARVALGGSVVTRPPEGQMAVLDEAQQHDIYASIIELRGDAAAVAALERGERVILGMRVSQSGGGDASTLENNGQGSYSDRIVVLWRNTLGRRASSFMKANTFPTAQYDPNQANNPDISARRGAGEDVTGDGVLELGRLREGTYAMKATTHPNPRSAGGTRFSLRPNAGALLAGANRIERNTNHDGFFDGRDPNRLHPLNDTFKIHSGSRTNNDSAGCQTIAPGDYPRFERDVRGGTQTTWQYVLTRVLP